MKQKIFSLLIIIFSFVFVISPVFNQVSAQDGESIPCPLQNCDLIDIFGSVVGIIRPVVIVTLVGVIIVAGYTRMSAAGDPEKEKKSMQILTSAIVGFLIIVFAGVIVQFLGALIGAPTIT